MGPCHNAPWPAAWAWADMDMGMEDGWAWGHKPYAQEEVPRPEGQSLASGAIPMLKIPWSWPHDAWGAACGSCCMAMSMWPLIACLFYCLKRRTKQHEQWARTLLLILYIELKRARRAVVCTHPGPVSAGRRARCACTRRRNIAIAAEHTEYRIQENATRGHTQDAAEQGAQARSRTTQDGIHGIVGANIPRV
eukprot:scaffold8292_cov120-Isochrysis_galbana.AAC.4